jgi:CHAD domain-containing protein
VADDITKRAEKAISRAASDRKAKVAAGALAATGAAVIAGKAGVHHVRGRPDGSGPSRAYRLKRGERLNKGIRRVAHGRAASAVEQLEQSRDGDFAESVHEARKDLKKLRSVLRLVRDDLGKKHYRQENGRYREAGLRLSAARDAEVKLQTLESVEESLGEELPPGSLSGFHELLEAERRQSRDDNRSGEVEEAVAMIDAGRGQIADWPLERNGWSVLEPGLRRGYRRGRQGLKLTQADASAENVHEWRKRVKDLWYQLRLIQDAWPEVIGETADQAHELADLLGDHHDLALLAEQANCSPGLFSKPDLERLLAAIDARQSELLEDAFGIARRLYAEKPKDFTRRLRAYWRAWRTA